MSGQYEAILSVVRRMHGPYLDQFARELAKEEPTNQYFAFMQTPKTTAATRRIQFCSGHRLLNHESKCAHLHGHNYVAFITCEAPELDDVGRVVDFSCIKDAVGGWIDAHWDHGYILNQEDPNVRLVMEADLGTQRPDPMGKDREVPRRQKLYLMDCNPTAENMAKFLMDLGDQLLEPYQVKVTKVVLWETENCYAEVTKKE